MLRALAFVTLLCLTSACAEPPSKEMHQAQGAIDAARAAGAEQYAADELKGAVDALAQADVAVAAKDYRLALSQALDSRERAQNAARSAVDARARARGDAERELAEATAAIERAETRLKAPETARLPRKTVAAVEAEIHTARTRLQEARSALDREAYDQAQKTATAIAARIETALAGLAAAPPPAPRPRKR